MNREELEIILEDNLESNFKIKTDSNGQIVIYTGLIEDEDGELILISNNDSNDEDDEDSDTFYTPSDDFEEDEEESEESEDELDFD